MAVIVTLKEADGCLEGKQSREENGWQTSKEYSFFFPADEGEFYVAKLLIFIFFFCCHVKEHGSKRASLTHSRTGQEGAQWQAGVFPSYILLQCSQCY